MLPSSLNLYLSGAGSGQAWLMHFVARARRKQDGEMSPTQTREAFLCPDHPSSPCLDLAHHLFPEDFYPEGFVLPACCTESQSQG